MKLHLGLDACLWVALCAMLVGGASGALIGWLDGLGPIGGAFFAAIGSIPTWLILMRWIDHRDWPKTILLGIVSPFVGSVICLGFPLGAALVHWYIVFPTGILMAIIARSLVLTYGKIPVGPPTCNMCDYNLTGNTSGRCPECGNEVSLAQPPNKL